MSVSRETEVLAGVSRETRELLELYVQLLQAWNARINLISRRDIDNVWSRHIVDCLQLLPLLPPHLPFAADFGSGAGFPGLILSLVTKIPFTLVESDHRKAAFLREAGRLTQAPVTIRATRIESLPPLGAPAITARALAPLSELLTLAQPHLAQGGALLLQKGESVEEEIKAAEAAWTMEIERHISSVPGGGMILRITKVSHG